MPKLAATRITDKIVRSAKPRKGRYEIRDAALPGFMLRVSPTGSKSFYLQLQRGMKRKIGDAAIITLTRARKLALDMLQRHEAGERIESRTDRKPTLKQFLESDYAMHAEHNQKSGAQNVQRLLGCCGSLLAKRIDQISEIQIERWKAGRLKSGLSPDTVRRDLAQLKAALKIAVVSGLIPSNPAKPVKVKVPKHHHVRYLSDDERQSLLTTLKERDRRMQRKRESGNIFRLERGYETLPQLGEYADYLTPLVLLAMNTGLRRSELLSLRWDQVCLTDVPSLTVLAAHAKSSKTRHIPLNTVAVSILKEWRRLSDSNDLVFPGPSGQQMKSIKTAWGKLMENSGIERFRFHDLRHDFASRLVMAGVDLYRVKELLGHGSIEITQRYAHLAPHSLAEAVESLA